MNANAARACLAGFFLALGAASALRAEVKPLVVEGAPFPLTVQEWTPPARDFPITAYGAKPDGTAVTEAIEAAIDAADAREGELHFGLIAFAHQIESMCGEACRLTLPWAKSQ